MSAGDQWLFGRLRSMGEWRDHGLPGAVEESLEGALAGVDALRAAGVLGADDASAWRERLAAEAGGRRAAVPPSPEVRAGASGLLEELLAEVPAEDPWEDSGYERFGGALELLAAIGAADAAGGWDARLRARTGQASREEEEALTRELNAGGTEVELVAVRAGPEERRAGYRVVVVLFFADGVTWLLDKDPASTPEREWPQWRLTDDVGTAYAPGGGGGGDVDEHVTFRTAPPAGARRLELALEGDPAARFEVAL